MDADIEERDDAGCRRCPEGCVGANETEQSIPDRSVRFRLTNSQIARLSRDVAELRDLRQGSTALTEFRGGHDRVLAERDKTGKSPDWLG